MSGVVATRDAYAQPSNRHADAGTGWGFDISIPTVNGYTAVGPVNIWTSMNCTPIGGCRMTEGKIHIYGWATVTVNNLGAGCTVIYVRNDCLAK